MHASALPSARRTRQHTLIAWLALCVLVVQGLLPLAQARMSLARDGAAWAEVCSSSGARWVRTQAQARPGALASPATPDTPDTAAAHARCWACLLLAQAAVAPPPPSIALPLHDTPASTSPALPPGAEPRPARGLAAPRAPPLQS